MRVFNILRVLATAAIAAFAFASPSHAAITAFLSAGTTCAGGSSGSFLTSGPAVKVSLCLTATTEGICGTTYRFVSANAGENGRFSVTARLMDPAYNFSNIPVPTIPAVINNTATGDLGAGTPLNLPVPAAANQLLATLDITPQATATNASYVISLDNTVSSATVDGGDGTCGGGLATVNTPFTASFTFNISTAPSITNAGTINFTVGNAGSFTALASGAPAPTFAATGTLPAGVTAMTAAGVLAGTPAPGSAVGGPTSNGIYPLSVTATNGVNPPDTKAFSLVVAKRPNVITFPAIANQGFNASPFTIVGASATGGALTFTSTTLPVCTVGAATGIITFLSAGACSIDATQPGGVDYLVATPVTQAFTIAASAPAAPTAGIGTPGPGTASLAFTAPTNTGGSAILDYTVTCVGPTTFAATGAGSPIANTGMTNGATYACSVTARNVIGSGPASAVVNITPALGPPAFTSVANTTFTVGVAGSYNVTATNSPTFASPGPFPTGTPNVTLSAAGVLSGTPTVAGTFPFTITATGSPPAATQAFTLTVSRGSQTITFGAIAGQPFNASPLALTGTASSGLAVSYISTTTGVCTVAGASVTFLAAGNCSITASQAGNANYNAAAPTVTQAFTITASVPSAPTIGVAQPGNIQAFIGFTPPASTGGSPILDYTATCTGGAGGTGTGTTSPINVPALVNGTLYTCSVTARNVTGSSAASGTVTVTPAPITAPGAPTIGGASPGNGLAIVTFTPPASNGGSAITSYTASCVTGALPAVTASAPAAPITVSGLTNNSLYSCTVTATNIQGTGAASAPATVTPKNVPIALTSDTVTAPYGASVVLISTVTGNGQTGTVAFSVNTGTGVNVLAGCAAVPLVSGLATCVAPGALQNQNPRTYVAAYSGNASNAAASIAYDQRVLLNNASLTVSANPLQAIVSGRSVTLTALVKMTSPVGTVTFFDNAVPITGCTQLAIAILPNATDAAVATCTITAPAATKTYVATYFYPAGHVSGRVIEQTNFDLRTISAGPTDYTNMWWAGSAENGWGMTVTQHGPIQFNVIYAYDNLGKPLWYVMANGTFNAAGNVVSGDLFQPTSSPFSAYNPASLVVTKVGTATITYTSASAATLAYTINGVSGSKAISPFVFGTAATGANLLTSDIWWAGVTQNGWGLNILQQGRTLFPVWYTYGTDGKTTFYTGQNGSWNGTVWSGTVFTTASSAWLGVAYSPSLLTSTSVGTMSIDFSDANNAVFSYTVNGVTQSKRIERLAF